MKNTIKPFLLPALLTLVVLSACGKKPEEVPAPAPVVEAPAEAAPATPAAPANEPGGYVPTAEERIPGITKPVDAAPAETAPTDSAPAETAPDAAPAPEAAPAN